MTETRPRGASHDDRGGSSSGSGNRCIRGHSSSGNSIRGGCSIRAIRGDDFSGRT